jgi:hypothetical protein
LRSVAPVVGDCEDGGGVVLEKGRGSTPLGRLCKFRLPGRAAISKDEDNIA